EHAWHRYKRRCVAVQRKQARVHKVVCESFPTPIETVAVKVRRLVRRDHRVFRSIQKQGLGPNQKDRTYIASPRATNRISSNLRQESILYLWTQRRYGRFTLK